MHHRLGVGAWTQKKDLPKASASEGEKNDGPSARAQARTRHVLFCLLIQTTRLYVFRFGLVHVDLRITHYPPRLRLMESEG